MLLKERLKGVNLGGWFSQVDCIEEKDPQGFPGFFTHAETFLSFEDLSNTLIPPISVLIISYLVKNTIIFSS